MKKIYYLSLHVCMRGYVENTLRVSFMDRDAAMCELNKWATKYRTEWNVPETENENRHITPLDGNEVSCYFSYRDKPEHAESRFFFGRIGEESLMEEGEQVLTLQNRVVCIVSHPHILARTYSVGTDRTKGTILCDFINMNTRKSCEMSEDYGPTFEFADEEQSVAYYTVLRMIEIKHSVSYKTFYLNSPTVMDEMKEAEEKEASSMERA